MYHCKGFDANPFMLKQTIKLQEAKLHIRTGRVHVSISQYEKYHINETTFPANMKITVIKEAKENQ